MKKTLVQIEQAMPRLDLPSRHDVELAIKALAIEDEREKQQVRTFWERQRQQRPGLSVNWKELGKFVLQVLVGVVLVSALVILWLAAGR